MLGCAYVFVTTCCDIVSLNLTTMCPRAPTGLFDPHKDPGGRTHFSLSALEVQRGEVFAERYQARKGQGLDWNPEPEDWQSRWVGSRHLPSQLGGKITCTTCCCFWTRPTIWVYFNVFWHRVAETRTASLRSATLWLRTQGRRGLPLLATLGEREGGCSSWFTDEEEVWGG